MTATILLLLALLFPHWSLRQGIPFGTGSQRNGGLITVTDNFMRANANPLSNAGGNVWNVPTGCDALQISGDVAVATITTGALNAEYNSAVSNLGQVTMTISAIAPADYAQVEGRSNSTCNHYNITVGGSDDPTLYLQKNNGVPTFQTVSYSWSTGDKIELDISGTSTVSLTAKVNGVTVATATDSSSPITSGDGGFGVQAISGGTTTQVSGFCASATASC